MKKIIFTAGVIAAILFSCDSNDELYVLPGKGKMDSLFKYKPADSLKLIKIPDTVFSVPVLDTGKLSGGGVPPVSPTPVPPASEPPTPVQPTPVQPTPDPVTPPAPAPDPVIPVAPVVPMPPADPVPVEPMPPVTPSPVTNQDKFNIIFKLNFNKNTTGEYKESEWRIDWNSPPWANHRYGYGKIVEDGANKYLKQSYPAGAFGASEGYQWYGKFDQGYEELYFSYRLKFSSGFSTTKLDGKLPGLSGGASNSGGDCPTGKDGWSGRYMFKGTAIKFYLYHPDIYKFTSDSYPVSGKNYYGQGPFLNPGYTLKPEVWYTVTQRIVMNTPGKADGIVEGYINGKLCAVETGIRFRDISTLKIDRIFFGNFFGGSGVPPTKTEAISFDDFYVYTYAPSVNIARNKQTNPSGTTILLPNF